MVDLGREPICSQENGCGWGRRGSGTSKLLLKGGSAGCEACPDEAMVDNVVSMKLDLNK